MMSEISDRWILVFYLLLMTLAELTTSYYKPEIGLIFHIIILLTLFIHFGILTNKKILTVLFQRDYIKDKKRPSKLLKQFIDKKEKLTSFILALTLIPLIRIMSLVLPLSSFSRIQWFIIVGIAIYLSLIVLIIQQKINIKECGIKLPQVKHIPIEIGIILFAIPMGFLEYYILKPQPFISSLSIENLIGAILILFIATGLMEELIFRGLLQKKAIETMGIWQGLLFVTVLFAILHIGNLSIWDVILVFFIGGIYALVVNKTNSILGVTISHTIVNIFLFIILPLKII